MARGDNQENGASAEKQGEQRVREDLLKLVSEGTRQSEIARGADASETAITHFLKGDEKAYGASFKNLTGKLERYLASRSERRELLGGLPVNPEYFLTPTSKAISGVLSYAHIACDIALVLSGPGLGKTETCKRYAATRPNVWHVEFTRSFSRQTVALGYICRSLGLKPTGRTPGELEDAIVEKVRGTQGLLICDEGQHLDTAAIDAIRGIHDKAKLGVCFLGNESLYTRLTGGARSPDHSQITSRIGKRLRLTKAGRGDVEALAEAWRVDNADAIDLLFAISQKPGALRTCTKVLRLAHVYASGGAITSSEVKAGWTDLTAGE